MSSFAVEAQKQIDGLVRELSELDARRKSIEAQIVALRAYVQVALHAEIATVPEEPRRRAPVKDQIIAVVEQTLIDGIPRKTDELVRIIEERGIVIGGADRRLTLSSILSRAKSQFQSSRRDGWSLRKENPAQGGASDDTDLV